MDKSQFAYTLYKIIVFNIQKLGLTRHTLFLISSIGRVCGFAIVSEKLVRKFCCICPGMCPHFYCGEYSVSIFNSTELTKKKSIG